MEPYLIQLNQGNEIEVEHDIDYHIITIQYNDYFENIELNKKECQRLINILMKKMGLI